jgi:hypothetical protein
MGKLTIDKQTQNERLNQLKARKVILKSLPQSLHDKVIGDFGIIQRKRSWLSHDHSRLQKSLNQ